LDLQNEFEEIDSEFNRTFKKEVLLIFWLNWRIWSYIWQKKDQKNQNVLR
jgi:hypothetical protein